MNDLPSKTIKISAASFYKNTLSSAVAHKQDSFGEEERFPFTHPIAAPLDEATRIRMQQTCRDMPQSLVEFTEAVHDYTERQSLSEWSFHPVTANSNDTKEWFIPKFDRHLLASAFGGNNVSSRRIAFVGDSTTFYTFQSLERLLLHPLQDVSNNHNTTSNTLDPMDKLATMNLTRAIHVTEQWDVTTAHPSLLRTHNHVYTKQYNIMWRGFHGPNVEDNCDFETHVWQDVIQQQPHILVVNWGLHMLFRPRVQICNVWQWLHYEDYVLQKVMDIVNDSIATTKLVLFKTTNLICKDLENIQAKHSKLCRPTIYRWRDRYQKEENAHVTTDYGQLTNDEIDRYCNGSILLESSSAVLNQRLEQFVKNYQQQYPDSRVKVAIYNDHDMESCAYRPSEDRLHFKALQMPRIRLLAIAIHCLLGESDGTE